MEREDPFYIKVSMSKEILQEEIDLYSGLTMNGLYQGDRRVRACQVVSRDFQLSDDEQDLISAIGGNCISEDMNPVELN